MKTKVESAHGGPGRIRTSNQTVMSAVTLSETSIKSGVFRHVNQRMFTIGCGQSLAKRWLARDAWLSPGRMALMKARHGPPHVGTMILDEPSRARRRWASTAPIE